MTPHSNNEKRKQKAINIGRRAKGATEQKDLPGDFRRLCSARCVLVEREPRRWGRGWGVTPTCLDGLYLLYWFCSDTKIHPPEPSLVPLSGNCPHGFSTFSDISAPAIPKRPCVIHSKELQWLVWSRSCLWCRPEPPNRSQDPTMASKNTKLMPDTWQPVVFLRSLSLVKRVPELLRSPLDPMELLTAPCLTGFSTLLIDRTDCLYVWGTCGN